MRESRTYGSVRGREVTRVPTATCVDFLVELIDNFGWRVLGRAEVIHQARLEAWQKLADGWEVRQRLRTRRCHRLIAPALPGALTSHCSAQMLLRAAHSV